MSNKETIAAERAALIQYAHDNLSSNAYWLFCDRLRDTEDHSPDNIRSLMIKVVQEVTNV